MMHNQDDRKDSSKEAFPQSERSLPGDSCTLFQSIRRRDHHSPKAQFQKSTSRPNAPCVVNDRQEWQPAKGTDGEESQFQESAPGRKNLPETEIFKGVVV
jgi:hypothetical protein